MRGLIKLSAGNYVTNYRRHQVQVILETTAYGDTGWNAYIFLPGAPGERASQIVTDYPRTTRHEALVAGARSVDARLQEAR